jgi:hypothetical protein
MTINVSEYTDLKKKKRQRIEGREGVRREGRKERKEGGKEERKEERKEGRKEGKESHSFGN